MAFSVSGHVSTEKRSLDGWMSHMIGRIHMATVT